MVAGSNHPKHTVLARKPHACLCWPDARACHSDVLAAHRRRGRSGTTEAVVVARSAIDTGPRRDDGLVAVTGLHAVVRDRSFAETGVVSSRRDFGIHLREGHVGTASIGCDEPF